MLFCAHALKAFHFLNCIEILGQWKQILVVMFGGLGIEGVRAEGGGLKEFHPLLFFFFSTHYFKQSKRKI